MASKFWVNIRAKTREEKNAFDNIADFRQQWDVKDGLNINVIVDSPSRHFFAYVFTPVESNNSAKRYAIETMKRTNLNRSCNWREIQIGSENKVKVVEYFSILRQFAVPSIPFEDVNI